MHYTEYRGNFPKGINTALVRQTSAKRFALYSSSLLSSSERYTLPAVKEGSTELDKLESLLSLPLFARGEFLKAA